MKFLMADLLEKAKLPTPRAERFKKGPTARMIEYNNRTYTIATLADEQKVNYGQMKYALREHDYNAEKAVNYLKKRKKQ
jgi:hypothetical protein